MNSDDFFDGHSAHSRGQSAPVAPDDDGDGAPLGTLAFLEAPVMIEKALETTGRIVFGSKIWKAIPFAKTLEQMLRTNDDDKKIKQQEKDDGTKVIKVSDAIKIVQLNIDGMVGTLNEAADLLTWLDPVGGSDPINKRVSLTGRIAAQLRKKALGQKIERVPGRFVPPLRSGRPVGGSASDGGYPSRRRGAPGAG